MDRSRSISADRPPLCERRRAGWDATGRVRLEAPCRYSGWPVVSGVVLAAGERPTCSGAVALKFAVCRDFGPCVSRPRCATANKNRP
jgi:hypothetical protein